MAEKEKSPAFQTFSIWFGLAALMFGTQVGGSMSAGTYAVGYMATYGGGWLLVFLGIYFLFRTFFSIHGLEFGRMYGVSDYSSYYLALYGLHGPNANPVLKTVVMTFFDIYSTLGRVITVAATIVLFGKLMDSMLGIPVNIGRLIAVVLFAFLTMYGAGFLRKMNTVMTVIIVAAMMILIGSVCAVRGDVLLERLGNFNIGPEWNEEPVSAHIALLISYALASSNVGATLCNFSDRIRSRRDAIGSGILIGLFSIAAFGMTSLIVLPFLPEMFVDTPILDICGKYLNPAITAIYWATIFFSVISTAPPFTYSNSNRFLKLWKTDKVKREVKILVLSLVFLMICYIVSGVGLMALVRKGYSALGAVGGVAIGIPIIISLFRMWKKDRDEKAAAGQA